MPTFLSCRILSLPDTFYFPNSKANRIPPSRSDGTKRDSPHPRNGGVGSADQTVVQDVADTNHDSLPRFAQHRNDQWLKSRKSHRINNFYVEGR